MNTNPSGEDTGVDLQEVEHLIDTVNEELDRSAETAATNGAPAKKSLGERLRGLTRLRVVRLSEAEAAQAPGDAQESPSKPAKRDKARKKPRKKTAKRPRAKKQSAAHARSGKQAAGGSKRTVLVVCVLLALVALGSGGFVVFRTMQANGSPEGMLAKAQKLTGQGKYEQAIELYGKVIDDGELAADAYLGMADTLEDAEDAEAALPKLEAGYQETGDERLLERYEEIAGTLPETAEYALPAVVGPIEWVDPVFEEMIRDALEIPAGQAIYASDLSSVTTLRILGGTHAVAVRGGESSGISNRNNVDSYEIDGVVYSERGGITSLSDVRHFTNLTRLTVAYNRVESVDGVQHLDRLKMLGLYANEIEDISALSGMTNLRWLYLFNNRIADISPLATLSGLEELSLQHNNIADLSPLAGLQNLEELYMSNNRIADLTPLATLDGLRFLFVQNNEIESLAALSGLPRLTDINFTGNPVVDDSPASHIPNVNRSFAYTG